MFHQKSFSMCTLKAFDNMFMLVIFMLYKRIYNTANVNFKRIFCNWAKISLLSNSIPQVGCCRFCWFTCTGETQVIVVYLSCWNLGYLVTQYITASDAIFSLPIFYTFAGFQGFLRGHDTVDRKCIRVNVALKSRLRGFVC